MPVIDAQHTPGPWRVGGFTGNDVVVPPRLVRLPDGEKAWAVSIVASVHNPTTDDFGVEVQDKSDELTDPVVKANARLIAAAPDLLAAVEELAAEADQALAYISTRTDADARAAQLEGTLMQAIDASLAIAEQARGETEGA